jgi:O-antigen ligase
MIRLTVFWTAVLLIGAYSWKDWFWGLCGLIIMVGLLEMPDVPKTVFGISGLNFFNALLLNVIIAWLVARHRENLEWDFPAHIWILLVMYLGIVLFGFYRMYGDRSYLEHETTSTLIREYLINTIKWAIPGIMLYDGCRTRQRVVVAVLAVAGIYLFLGVMVIKVMPIRAVMLSGTELQKLALKLLLSRVGLHRVTLSMMLAGGSWAFLSLRGLTTDRRLRLLAMACFFVVFYGQSLTGGRAGYITWGIIGLTLCLLRWRGYLLIAPLAVALLLVFVPSVGDRLFEGFIRNQFNSSITVNDYDVTAGRNVIWPLVIDKIQHGMWLGFGRMAMWRTGIVAYASTVLAEDFGHPHNAYLEWLLDNGIVGFVPVVLFYIVALYHALRLFCDRRSGLFMTAGGTAAAHILALLGASMGSQSFYPIEGTIGMWCAIGIMLRVSVNRTKALAVLAAEQTSEGRPFALAVPRPAAAAASIETLMWPLAKSIFSVPQKPPSTATPVPIVPRATTPRATTPGVRTPRDVPSRSVARTGTAAAARAEPETAPRPHFTFTRRG